MKILYTLLLACSAPLFQSRALAQGSTPYPSVSSLSTALAEITAEQRKNFPSLKGRVLNEGDVLLYGTDKHITDSDAPNILSYTATGEHLYVNTLQTKLPLSDAEAAYSKWQQLLAEALPGFLLCPGATMPDARFDRYFSAGDSPEVMLRLTREREGEAWQITIAVCKPTADDLAALRAKRG
jgi:hypothetical protein